MNEQSTATVVLDVRGMNRPSEQNVVAATLCRLPGVRHVEVNPVAQSANVAFDPARTSLSELRRWVHECGYHCAGQSAPTHICDPMQEPDTDHARHADGHRTAQGTAAAAHGQHQGRPRRHQQGPSGHGEPDRSGQRHVDAFDPSSWSTCRNLASRAGSLADIRAPSEHHRDQLRYSIGRRVHERHCRRGCHC
jgi:P-type Cu2+ transporter